MDREIRNLKMKAYRDKPAVARSSHRERSSGGAIAGYGFGLAISSKAPPPVVEYEQWLAVRGLRRNANMTGSKLRRIVIMTRGGSAKTEIANAVGVTSGVVRKWLLELPENLRP